MSRNFDIAEFRETDDLSPMATRKLNSNFRRVLSLMLDLQLEGVDTASIAEYVLGIVDDDIDGLDVRIDGIEDWIDDHGGEGGGGGTAGVTRIRGEMDLTDPGEPEVWYDGDVTILHEQIAETIEASDISDMWDSNVYDTTI